MNETETSDGKGTKPKRRTAKKRNKLCWKCAKKQKTKYIQYIHNTTVLCRFRGDPEKFAQTHALSWRSCGCAHGRDKLDEDTIFLEGSTPGSATTPQHATENLELGPTEAPAQTATSGEI